ncbi:MAG: SHOCT domain-containing protein [Phycisphaerae bacterium]|jgi:hypothetical protein|nr:SHOCT domain-containing protein [Phycisphaerae bacterium]
MAGILIWVIQLTGRRSAGDMAGIRSALGAVEVFYIIFLLATIVATIVRLRLSPTLIIRIVQGFCASVFVIFALVALIYSISRYTDLPKSYGSKMLFDFMFGLLLQLALIASGIVAVIHAAAIKIRSKTLSQTSLYLSFGALMCFFGYLIIGPAIASRQSEMILLMTNMVLLVAPLVIMFCAGLTGFICSILTGQSASHVAATSPTASPAPAPAPAPGGGSVQERLRKLSELQQQGLITDKEYADKRAEILDGL